MWKSLYIIKYRRVGGLYMEKYILFKNMDQEFAIDISEVEKIIEFETPKKIPESLDYLLGVIKYEDSILPVLDLNMRLYGEKSKKDIDTKIIIVKWKDRQMGILVDNIIGINDFSQEDYEESNLDANISNRYTNGFIKLEDEIIMFLDIDEILNPKNEEKLIEELEAEELELREELVAQKS